MDSSNTATAEQRRDEGLLTGLGALVKEAAAFTDGVDVAPEYRARVFDLAIDRLSRGATKATAPTAPQTGGPPPADVQEVTPIGLATLARELELEPRALARVVTIGEDGAVSIVGRVEGRTNAEMQVQFSAVYAFVKDRLFSLIDVPNEELRELCRQKRCYNKDHFADYYSKSDLFSPVGDAKARAYRLTKKGLEGGKTLLKKMAES